LTFRFPYRTKAPAKRIYALRRNWNLNRRPNIKITGEILEQTKIIQLFAFNFRTGSDGRPVAF